MRLYSEAREELEEQQLRVYLQEHPIPDAGPYNPRAEEALRRFYERHPKKPEGHDRMPPEPPGWVWFTETWLIRDWQLSLFVFCSIFGLIFGFIALMMWAAP